MDDRAIGYGYNNVEFEGFEGGGLDMAIIKTGTVTITNDEILFDGFEVLHTSFPMIDMIDWAIGKLQDRRLDPKPFEGVSNSAIIGSVGGFKVELDDTLDEAEWYLKQPPQPGKALKVHMEIDDGNDKNS